MANEASGNRSLAVSQPLGRTQLRDRGDASAARSMGSARASRRRRLSGVCRSRRAPDLVNLSSLPDGDGYLAERTAIIHYLTTERDLLVADRDAGAPGGLLTVGGPAFDEGPTTPLATEARRGIDCQSLAQIHFENLPGSLSEVAEIGNLWPKTSTSDVTLLSGAAATETAVKKAVAGRRVVHLATHGFVLGTDCESNPAGVRAVGGLARTSTRAAAVTEEILCSAQAWRSRVRTGVARTPAIRTKASSQPKRSPD